MNLPETTCLALLLSLATACIVDSKSIGEGESGSETSADTGAMESTTGGPVDPSATSMASGEATTAPPSGSTTDGPATATAGDTGSAETGPAMQCDIEIEACAQADLSKMEPLDCGYVTPLDPLQDWLDLRDCILDAKTQQIAFKALYEVQGIDSVPRFAFVGQAGAFYAMMQLSQDSGGFAGIEGPVNQIFCADIVALPACDPGVGEICLSCEGDDGQVLCGP